MTDSAGRQPIVSLRDCEATARRSLAPGVRAYVVGGVGDETTVRWNRRALNDLRICPCVLAGLSTADTQIDLLGLRLRMPIILAPVGLQRLIHPDGEVASAAGATRAGTVFTVSTAASTSLEQVAHGARGPLWFQLYAQRDWESTARLVRRAELSNYRAIVATVDAHLFGPRDRQQRHGFDSRMFEYPNVAPARLDIAPLTWSDVGRIRALTTLPLVLKGILTAEDAVRACDAGADAIVVSNHGGRVLDGLPPTAEVLPWIVDAVDGRVPVLVDGGIRRGTDVLKMLALGATAVLIGRMYLYGLRVGGAEGVAEVLEILLRELTTAMALCGRPALASIDHTVLWAHHHMRRGPDESSDSRRRRILRVADGSSPLGVRT